MKRFPPPIQNVLEQFARLPGIGPKTAERYVFYLLKRPREEVNALAEAIRQLQQRVQRCSVCFTFSETNPCEYCADSRRDTSLVCVVADSVDVLAIEKTGEYRGRYHVLGGVLRPTEGITPDRLRLDELFQRVQSDGVHEIIIATNPDVEGEATALYITKMLQPTGVTVTRLAKGLPMGSDVEYADEVTLSNALRGRRPV